MYPKPTIVGQTVINDSSYNTLGTSYTSNGTTVNSSLTLGMGCPIPTSSLTISNSNNMNEQVKIAVFKVTRNKYNQIKSSEFITEMWVEKKPGVSIDFAVAKKLDNKYEADEIVIKQIFTVTL
jgi:hypothetical protein